MDNRRIVASLSCVPYRMSHIHLVIKNLLNQTHPLNAIYLHMPYRSRKGEIYSIPQSLFDLEDNTNFRINRIDEDLGPISKLIPVLDLETDPNTLIITFDDDILVGPNVVKILADKSVEYPNACLGFAGCCMGNFPFYYQLIKSGNSDTSVDWIQGVHGGVYPRKFFDKKELLDFPSSLELPKNIHELLLVHDDHWISCYLEQKNIPRIVIASKSIRENFKEIKFRENYRALSSQHLYALKNHQLSWHLKNKGLLNKSSVPTTSIVFIAVLIIVICVVIKLFVSNPYVYIFILLLGIVSVYYWLYYKSPFMPELIAS